MLGVLRLFMVEWLLKNKDGVVAKPILGIGIIPHHPPRTPFDVCVFKQLGTSRRQTALQMTGALDNAWRKTAD